MKSALANEAHSFLPALGSAEHDFYSLLSDTIDRARKDDENLRKTIFNGVRANVQREGWSSEPPVSFADMREYLRALDRAMERIEQEAVKRGAEKSTYVDEDRSPIGSPPHAPAPLEGDTIEQLVRRLHQANMTDGEPEPSFDEVRAPVPVIYTPPKRSMYARRGRRSSLSAVVPYDEFDDWEPAVPTLSAVRQSSPIITQTRAQRSVLLPVLRLAGAAAVAVALYALIAGRADLGKLHNKWRMLFAGDQVGSTSVQQSSLGVGATVELPASVPALPNSYGVFAVSNGSLSELAPLPVRVPDQRVFMSAPITAPSRTTLPDGKVAFIAFRRDLATDAPEKVSIRVVARVVRTLTFNPKGGKATYKKVDAEWAVRGNSYEYTVAPLAGRADMVILRPASDSFVLPAGRYALVLKGQGYDFNVDGPMTELAHCIESAETTNGPIYSECRTL
jgi:hypothetical protein